MALINKMIRPSSSIIAQQVAAVCLRSARALSSQSKVLSAPQASALTQANDEELASHLVLKVEKSKEDILFSRQKSERRENALRANQRLAERFSLKHLTRTEDADPFDVISNVMLSKNKSQSLTAHHRLRRDQSQELESSLQANFSLSYLQGGQKSSVQTKKPILKGDRRNAVNPFDVASKKLQV